MTVFPTKYFIFDATSGEKVNVFSTKTDEICPENDAATSLFDNLLVFDAELQVADVEKLCADFSAISSEFPEIKVETTTEKLRDFLTTRIQGRLWGAVAYGNNLQVITNLSDLHGYSISLDLGGF